MALLLCSVTVGVATGAIGWGDPVAVSDTKPDDALHKPSFPAAAFNAADGETLVAFAANGPVGGEYVVRGHRVTRSGAETGDDVTLSGDTNTLNHVRAAVAADPEHDRWLVVWPAFPDGGGDQDVFGQLVDGNGDEIGGDFPISGPPDDDLIGSTPAVAYNASTDEYLVVWDRQGALPAPQIWAQRVTAAGAVSGDAFKVSKVDAISTDRFAISPAVAAAPSGEWLVVFTAEGVASRARKAEIFLQRVASSATPVAAAPSRISETTTDDDPDEDGASSPDVAVDPSDGRALVVFMKPPDADSSERIFGQLVGADGLPSGGDTQLTSVFGFVPRVAVDPGNGYMVVFAESVDQDADPIAQAVTAGGTPSGSHEAVAPGYADRSFDNLLAHDVVRLLPGPGRADVEGAWLAVFDMTDENFLPEVHAARSGPSAPTPTPTPGPTPTPPATPAATPTPTPTATPAAQRLPAFASVVTLPAAKRCASRRRFRIHVQVPKGLRATKVTVTVNGRRAKVVKGRRISAPVDLRGLPKGRFTVKIVVTFSDGRKVAGTRRYRTCVPGPRR
jgi:hypothetical protein